MSEMEERVAKRLAHIEGVEINDEHRLMARAAIEEMREPTEEMLNAAAFVDRYADPGTEWGPMINAALGRVDA